jgi:uncharacterized DUF497 family protein
MYIPEKPDLFFEWDPGKARSNKAKHGVSFREATSAFADEEALLLPDPDYFRDEDRFVLLGISSALHLVVVVHCLRGNGDVIRIISGRKANRAEVRQYEERLRR